MRSRISSSVSILTAFLVPRRRRSFGGLRDRGEVALDLAVEHAGGAAQEHEPDGIGPGICYSGR
jgi:hypothetical protein